ncbi:MAG: large conductance mechanosensitive channel protein MscL [Bacteroidales bacterium]|nr:large conductance mechanosensitive channel protein MscL [Bacteroidales bacterium]
MSKFVKEFKEFALKGNVMDMAVGVIIGGAFGKIISSLVDDIIMPLIGKLVGNVDFTNMYVALSDQPAGLSLDAAKELGAVFAYGQFIQNVIDFLIIALCIFMMIKGINSLKRRTEKQQEAAPAEPPAPSNEEVLLTEIRDLLKEQKNN